MKVESAVSNVSGDAGIAPIHQMVAAAVEAGWPVQAAFECAMQLLCHGCTIREVQIMFAHCERCRQ